MNGRRYGKGAVVLLSFNTAYAALARQLAIEFEDAGIGVRYDPWKGAAGVSATQSIGNTLDGATFVVPLLTPSEATSAWVGKEWKRTVFDEACARGIAVLPVLAKGEIDAVPEFLRGRSFCNIQGDDRAHEMRRLFETVRELSEDSGAAVPLHTPATGAVKNPMAVTANPIVLELGSALTTRLADSQADPFLDHMVPMMRDGLFFELGVKFPKVHLQTGGHLAPWEFRILINDVPDLQLTARPDALLVNENVDTLAGLGIDAEPAVNPVSGAPFAWVSAHLAEADAIRQLTTWDTQGYLILALSAVLRRRAVDFLGVNEVRAMLHQVETVFPHLVAETVPKTLPLFLLVDVLRRLVGEGVCVRNLHRILMSLADRGREEQDPLYLSEYVRAQLQRQITHRLSRGTGQLIVLLLDPDIENAIRDATRHTATGSYVDLDPIRLQQIMTALREPMLAFPREAQLPQILTDIGIRAALRRLVAPSMPDLHVLSYSELRPDVSIQPVGRVTFAGFRGRKGVRVGDRLLWD